MINPIFLRTFMSLAKTKHFTQTAEALNMTQPGVSQHIHKLENELGEALLNRFGKKFELTRAGEILLQYGLQYAEAESNLRETLKDDDPYRGDVKLTCSGAIAMLLYPELLKIQQQQPTLRICIEAAPNATIVERVTSNLSDIGVVTLPTNDPNLVTECIGQDALCLIVPRENRATWHELMELGFINHPDGHHYADQLLERNFNNDFKGMEHIPESGYINQLSQILLPVSLGLGFTALPKSAVKSFNHQDKIRIIEFSQPINEPIYLITKKHRTLAKRYPLITQLLKNTLAG